mmetsp:Transcript_54322/g.151249  ORF Transcript_54322/g.151249 Transcript_54322/m.151249 type:complete len:203 (-) Transcript_54322:18-626(-)
MANRGTLHRSARHWNMFCGSRNEPSAWMRCSSFGLSDCSPKQLGSSTTCPHVATTFDEPSQSFLKSWVHSTLRRQVASAASWRRLSSCVCPGIPRDRWNWGAFFRGALNQHLRTSRRQSSLCPSTHMAVVLVRRFPPPGSKSRITRRFRCSRGDLGLPVTGPPRQLWNIMDCFERLQSRQSEWAQPESAWMDLRRRRRNLQM